MKVKNKKTGDTYERTMPIVFNIKTSDGGEHTVSCKSIAKLNEEWEDMPEDTFYLEGIQDITWNLAGGVIIDYATGKEAERAFERLKAWRKLKDNDLHIEWSNTPEYDENDDRWWCSVDFSVREGCDGDKLFALLFGGEK